MPTINTRVHFEAAHRQYGDPSKCGYLHGHNWAIDVYVDSDTIMPVGYIVDFKDIQDVIDEYDHKVLLKEDDPLCDILEQAGQKVKRLKLNPTCECLSVLMLSDIAKVVPIFKTITIVVHENDKSNAASQASYADFRSV